MIVSLIKLPIDYDHSHWRIRKQAREEYIRIQNGKCWHCGEMLDSPPPKEMLDVDLSPCSFPPNFFKYPIHLHHNKKTGMSIGAVHNTCNAVLFVLYGE